MHYRKLNLSLSINRQCTAEPRGDIWNQFTTLMRHSTQISLLFSFHNYIINEKQLAFLISSLSYTQLTQSKYKLKLQRFTWNLFSEFLVDIQLNLLISEKHSIHSLKKMENPFFVSKPHFSLRDLIYWGNCGIFLQSIKPTTPQIPKHLYLYNT